jgi:hypothetical protein
MQTMFSTPERMAKTISVTSRFASWCVLGAAAFAAMGCASSAPQRAELSQATLAVDPAMQNRDWDQSVAYYASGAVPAWNTRFWYTPSPKSPQAIKPITEPVAFAGQVVFLPIALVIAPPFTHVIYHGVQEPASSNAFPAPPKP